MNRILMPAALSMAMLLGSSASFADSSVKTLSPELRKLLSQEMLALQDGMKSILPAYISGDLKQVAHIADKMKNSYIIKQSITEDQKHEVMNKLPKAFLHRDKKFHDYAGMLKHVAEEKHLELVGFYYSKLSESCVGCHSEYARHKFPHLSEKPAHSDHH